MPTEIEKKYRLTPVDRESVIDKLKSAPAVLVSEDVEENIIYAGGTLDEQRSLLRLRRTQRGAWLTFKSSLDSVSEIKHRIEEESRVDDPDAVDATLRALGFTVRLVYEKRRMTWTYRAVEIVIDELPFGLYMEIEGAIEAIQEAEKDLGFERLEVEHSSYPQLTRERGQITGNCTESRFDGC
jgi:adenylate cyclase, class 2